ncbi:hydroxymethylglutaryl-CoA reductase, degradative [Bradyrhizobium sp. U87765 SZCCT0131]|uniref:hydroxymethylglutaryl-CoA reductase, degradative n=1 Tax=unclassified Bradyrhizobium TaxID=2631580 RepID=UPI001BAC0388|nr:MULTISPECIES: hydroxymethylglutaryl-CoA reductase, degradative [unclassified Bradyrhizobium]MBR1222741.1 hydroxymethylglutaryl-CoA reductase, degradative [Bradyrhizobium sp. U87765 SZCCT0131]MBR1265178.1 hydroxymethylglutaryl-CoA reductase, degradative [Bradyrhizobium sp. U87765 SZCCT0134]MBR1303043.1 hydroxymethylglutaryl-CoA reductase, degradative [Bradyrhizobium sp. U87765 SZCCT0110]MBR1323741.1 hydroxymethylglutaryl-CoA reductase, degradative [Bradyrhizobium sp. U87765 SZCCT0109]MBR1346
MNSTVSGRNRSSRIGGFHRKSPLERLDLVAAFAELDDAAKSHLADMGNLPVPLADKLIENAIATMNVPIGIATNMKVDGEDVLVPMATEESSVVAAVCNAARQNHDSGFTTSLSGTLMIAQVQAVDVPDPHAARLRLLERRDDIKAICDACDPVLVKLGGGFRDLEVRLLETRGGVMLITHLIVDTRDAMGANAVNTMAEKVAPQIAAWSGGRVYLRILSNLADRRLARAHAVWKLTEIGGADVRDGMISAYQFAAADPYRAATHNKGIMNGISAVVLATGNDTRAVEAGAHAYAARGGHYSSLTHYEVTREGDLSASIELPMAVGLIGGATRLHPTAQACLKILGVRTAERLARIIAAVGLAQNFSALKALATVGIQKGHMDLHAQNIAMMAGAVGEEIDKVARALVAKGTVRVDVAEQVLQELRRA